MGLTIDRPGRRGGDHPRSCTGVMSEAVHPGHFCSGGDSWSVTFPTGVNWMPQTVCTLPRPNVVGWCAAPLLSTYHIARRPPLGRDRHDCGGARLARSTSGLGEARGEHVYSAERDVAAPGAPARRSGVGGQQVRDAGPYIHPCDDAAWPWAQAARSAMFGLTHRSTPGRDGAGTVGADRSPDGSGGATLTDDRSTFSGATSSPRTVQPGSSCRRTWAACAARQ